jgi:hypothetical protein
MEHECAVVLLLRTFYMRVISDHYTDHLAFVLVTNTGQHFFQDLVCSNYPQYLADLKITRDRKYL